MRAIEAYAQTGIAGEWHFHHQGGATGYEPREYLGNPTLHDVVTRGQAYAWNPSITGTQSEDTLLVGENRNEIITRIEGWETITFDFDGQVIERPGILEIE